MTISIIQTLYLMLPLIVGGLLHAIVIKKNYFRKLAVPIDFGKRINGKRIFGDNKTWRGLLFYTVLTSLLTLIQSWLYQSDLIKSISIINFNTTNGLFFGALLGSLNSLAELPNSFIKRQLSIDSGKTNQKYQLLQYFIDQVDAPLVISFVLYLLDFINIWSALIVSIVGTIMHGVIDNFIYYRKGIKKWDNSKKPWSNLVRNNLYNKNTK